MSDHDVVADLMEELTALRHQLAMSEERCKIYEDAYHDLQEAIQYAQHLLEGD